MKTTRKLLLALVLVMSILMTLAVAVIPASAVNANYKVIYMKPGVWNTDGAWFAVWSYSSSSDGQWAKFTDYDGDGVYSAYIPVGHTTMNLVRMNSSATTPDWDQKWNQTNNITINSYNYFTITGWNQSNYSRGTHTVASKNVCFPGAYNNWDSNTKATVSNGIATMTVKITNAQTYAFKVLVGDKWYSNSGTINGSTADNGWEMSTSVSGNCNLKITETGYYSFEFHLGTGYLSVHKHTGGTATCTAKAKCTVCGESYGELAGHTYNLTSDVEFSAATCTAPQYMKGKCSCGAISDADADKKLGTTEALGHTGGTATCTAQAVCTRCTTAYGELNANKHKDENKDHVCDYGCEVAQGTCSDSATDNDHVCDYGCGAVLETCSGGTATCTDKAVCTVCNNPYGEVDANKHKDENKDHACDYGCNVAQGTCSDSATDNDHVCDYGCGAVLETCSGGTATCTDKAVCDVCGESYGELNANNHASNDTYTLNDKAADCVNPGYTGDVYHSCCKVRKASGEEIPALGHSAGCGHATSEVDGVYYESIVDALEAAKSGDIVTLTQDVELSEEYLELHVTLDLAGHKLTVAGLYNNGRVVDSALTGSLTVKDGGFTFDGIEYQDENGNQLQVPVCVARGDDSNTFVFRAPKAQNKDAVETEGKVVIDFRPSFAGGEIGNDKLFADGSLDNDVKFEIRVTRTGADGTKTVQLPVSQELVKDVYEVTNRGFRLNITGAEAEYTYTIELVIYSCGVTVHNTELAVIPAAPATGDDDEQVNA